MWFKNKNKSVVESQVVESKAPTVRRMAHDEASDTLETPVLAEARQLLGYEPHAIAGSIILKAFTKIGIEALVRSDVDAYKSWMMERSKGKSWRHVPLKEYFAAVPLFALSQAVAIKRELPEAEIHVEYFGDDPDPFMAVLYRNCWYYFAAWDEPKFEGRATA